MPIIKWLQYADHEMAPMCRSVTQSMRKEHQAKVQAADEDNDGTLDRNEAKVVARNFDQIDARQPSVRSISSASPITSLVCPNYSSITPR